MFSCWVGQGQWLRYHAGVEPVLYLASFSLSLGGVQPERPKQCFQLGQIGGQQDAGFPVGQVGELAQVSLGQPEPHGVRPTLAVRKVQAEGWIHFRGKGYKVPQAFRGHPVALRPSETDGVMDVVFSHHTVTQIDLRRPAEKKTMC